MRIGMIETTWKRRLAIVVSFPVVVTGDMLKAARNTFLLAKWAWKRS